MKQRCEAASTRLIHVPGSGRPLAGMLSPQKVLRVLLLLLGFTAISLSKAAAQDKIETSNSFGLEKKELQAVLQKCFDLPGLQKYYLLNSAHSLQQLNIVQLPIAFPADLALTKGGKAVKFVSVSKAEFSRLSLDNYSMFRTIEHTGKTLKVNFNYFYKADKQSLKTVFVTIELQKSATGWNITNSNLEGATL